MAQRSATTRLAPCFNQAKVIRGFDPEQKEWMRHWNQLHFNAPATELLLLFEPQTDPLENVNLIQRASRAIRELFGIPVDDPTPALERRRPAPPGD